jgi:hypothetical protein
MTLDSYDIIQQGAVPLGKGVISKWMGITEEGVRLSYTLDLPGLSG